MALVLVLASVILPQLVLQLQLPRLGLWRQHLLQPISQLQSTRLVWLLLRPAVAQGKDQMERGRPLLWMRHTRESVRGKESTESAKELEFRWQPLGPN